MNASSLARHLRKYGIITVASYNREGYRVTGGNKVDPRVTIHCQFNLDAIAARRAAELADALNADGFTAENIGNGILHVSKAEAHAL